MTNDKTPEYKPRQMPYGAQHGVVCANIAHAIKQYLQQNPVAICFGAGTGFLIPARTPRLISLDAAVVRNDHLPPEGVGVDVFDGAPDLAIIVIAPTDKFNDIESDIEVLMDAGCKHVWILRPRVRMVTVHRAQRQIAIVGESEELRAEDVLPGFGVPAQRIFDGR